MPAAHDIYAEQLGELRRGHPLYYPEPRPEGPVEIGDVGYTKHGAFFRLFNASRPPDDPIQRFGVPEFFVPLDMGVIDTFEAALEPGPLHSRTISTLSAEIGTPGEILPAEASFRFGCSSKRGAILILETQMIHQEAVQHHRLENYLIQHAHSWHAFARSLDIRIGFGDLMLVTECSKAAAWSSAVYSNSSTQFGLSFSVGMPFTTAGITTSNSLEKIGPLERRRSQRRALSNGSPLPKDHTVFIKAYRLGMRRTYYQSFISLFMKAWGPSASGRRGDREGMDEVGRRPALPEPQGSAFSPDTTEIFVMRPYEPDFHASIVLLARALEASDEDCVVIHDNLWCSASSDSEESQIMKQYTDFYFSDEVDAMLNSISSEVATSAHPSYADDNTNPPVISTPSYTLGSSDSGPGGHNPDDGNHSTHPPGSSRTLYPAFSTENEDQNEDQDQDQDQDQDRNEEIFLRQHSNHSTRSEWTDISALTDGCPPTPSPIDAEILDAFLSSPIMDAGYAGLVINLAPIEQKPLSSTEAQSQSIESADSVKDVVGTTSTQVGDLALQGEDRNWEEEDLAAFHMRQLHHPERGLHPAEDPDKTLTRAPWPPSLPLLTGGEEGEVVWLDLSREHQGSKGSRSSEPPSGMEREVRVGDRRPLKRNRSWDDTERKRRRQI